MSGNVLTATGKMGLKISVRLVIIGAEMIAMEVVERSMDRAVIFDLYETLITENHPEWHSEAPTPVMPKTAKAVTAPSGGRANRSPSRSAWGETA